MDMIYNVRYDVAPNSISVYSNNPHDFRSYSYGGASSIPPPPLPLPPPPGQPRDWKLKKGKITSSSSKSWSFNDPEFQRKKRVASYKVYSVEGKVKGSFRRSFRWLKDKYTQVVYGWWWISPPFFFSYVCNIIRYNHIWFFKNHALRIFDCNYNAYFSNEILSSKLRATFCILVFEVFSHRFLSEILTIFNKTIIVKGKIG